MKRLLVVSLIAACGEDNLTCDYLASEENCWKTTAMAAVSCLPPDGAIGVLAADGTSCTYDTGQVVTFNNPVVLPLDFDAPWDFEITTNGQPCLAYVEGDDGFALTVDGQTVTESVAGDNVELTCPDGATFSNGNALELLSCPDGDFGGLPGNTSSSGTDSVVLALLNTGVEGSLTLFECQR